MTAQLKSRPSVEPLALLQGLQSRYAVKKFDPLGKIPAAEWTTLVQSLVLSPSSYGLQPWKFLVIEAPRLREALREASWGQGQIVDADKLVVILARTELDEGDVQKLIDRTAEVKGVPTEALEGYKGMLLNALKRPKSDLAAWNARQAYIALGSFLTAAAALGVDACPMEGFDPAAYDRLLGLEGTGYTAVVVATAGVAADRPGPKVRYPESELVRVI
jgi:nitroreductase